MASLAWSSRSSLNAPGSIDTATENFASGGRPFTRFSVVLAEEAQPIARIKMVSAIGLIPHASR